MHLFKSKKKEDPTPSPAPSSPLRDNRPSSVNGMNAPVRPPGQQQPQQQQPGQPGQPGQGQAEFSMSMNNGSNISNISTNNLNAPGSNNNSPRNNNMDQQYYMSQQPQQQQQQQYSQQQQQQYQQQQQSYQQNSMQGMQQGSYGNESMLTSQPIQFPYQQQQQNDMHNQGYNNNNGMENGSYDGGYGMDGEHQQHQQQQQQQQQQQHMANLRGDDMGGGNGQDGFYGQNNNNGNNNNNNPGGYDGNVGGYDGNSTGYDGTPGGYDNNVNAITSATLNLSGLGGNNNGNNYHNNMDNGNGNNGAMANGNNNNNSAGNSSITNSGELTLSADIRKLQDEVLSWKRSQETSQTKINQLRNTLTQKSQENRDLHQSLTQVTQDRLMLQELVHKREKEMDDLRSKYLNDVRQIRATDDDHSTIEQRVRMLQAAILQLTKSSSGDRAVNLNTEEAQALVKKRYKFGNSQPYILNMFLEKYIMDTLLEEVFNGPPFYVGFELSKEYGAIHKWMSDNNFQDQAVRFRQQLCFLSAKSPVAQEFANQEAIRISKGFEAKLERLYNNWTGHQKVLDLVTKAIDLSLTMRSQNAEIIAQVIPNETDFDAEKMVPAHKSKEGGKVKVCVMPCFIDTNGVVVGKAKVFCG
ncbi:hypothetical protein BGZ80_006043 [Entomortierella chlamydospora]|uniref:Uncharacterized protein n=1 Tax=Entomortierella chlamydospora TaxID=101097 RepID=A0A9P6MIC7_9FUNG|nr:hypothetical protein BGZ80_006043 [Entomortierella chlamydospora]